MSSVGSRALFKGLATAIACCLLAGCGGSEQDGKTGSRDAPEQQPTAPVEAAGPTITSPSNGDVVNVVDGVAIVFVKGRAAAGETLRVRAEQCGPNCEEEVRAGSDGSWSARVVAQAGRAPSLLITATQLTGGARPASVKLRLRKQGAGGMQPTASGPDRLLVIGDSLAIGMKPYLGRSAVSVDARIGRPLAEGMRVLSQTELSGDSSVALAISLFTNDDPANIAPLGRAVRTSLDRVGEGGCVVWATIAAPAVNGVTYARANALLESLADDEPRLQLVRWDAAVSRNPGLLEPDGVHPTAKGYALRSRLYLRAARRCGT
jgi:hypothetical protein